MNLPVFGIPSFGIPAFGIPVFGIPDFGIPGFESLSRGESQCGFPYLRNPCLRNPCFRNSHLRNPCFRNSHLRSFSRIQAPLNQTPLRLPPKKITLKWPILADFIVSFRRGLKITSRKKIYPSEVKITSKDSLGWSFWKHNAPNLRPVEVIQCAHRKHCYPETHLGDIALVCSYQFRDRWYHPGANL